MTITMNLHLLLDVVKSHFSNGTLH